VQDYSREYMRGRARVQGSACSYTLDELNALFIEQNGRCFYCGEVLVGTPHIEHMIPISRGGSNYIENIVLSCPPCNLRKYTKTSEEFLQC
jgi:5-methylcytosine-specific restriction endonuclease McrA